MGRIYVHFTMSNLRHEQCSIQLFLLQRYHSVIMAPYAEEGCKLFVYGVNEGTSNSELQAEFERFGTVTDTYNTGKGYAFVTFENKDDASEATDKLNGKNSIINGHSKVKLYLKVKKFLDSRSRLM